ncbi:MAG: hypothetical protein ACFFCD_11615 [Promethearchaeota archaeon]
MKFTKEKLAKMVGDLLRKRAEEERKRRLEEEEEDVHESDTGIDPESFKVVSDSQTEDGDTIIEFEAVQWVATEFTIDVPYQFNVKGKLLIKKDGKAELIKFV